MGAKKKTCSRLVVGEDVLGTPTNQAFRAADGCFRAPFVSAREIEWHEAASVHFVFRPFNPFSLDHQLPLAAPSRPYQGARA
jgi:hypothetical protein